MTTWVDWTGPLFSFFYSFPLITTVCVEGGGTHAHICSMQTRTCVLLSHTCSSAHMYVHTVGLILNPWSSIAWWRDTHTPTRTHSITRPLPKPKQWSIIWIHILLWATSVPLLWKNWSQNRLLTVNCRTLSRPLTTRKRPLWTHVFNRPAIRVNGSLVWELLWSYSTFVTLHFLKSLRETKHNSGFMEVGVVILECSSCLRTLTLGMLVCRSLTRAGIRTEYSVISKEFAFGKSQIRSCVCMCVCEITARCSAVNMTTHPLSNAPLFLSMNHPAAMNGKFISDHKLLWVPSFSRFLADDSTRCKGGHS